MVREPSGALLIHSGRGPYNRLDGLRLNRGRKTERKDGTRRHARTSADPSDYRGRPVGAKENRRWRTLNLRRRPTAASSYCAFG